MEFHLKQGIASRTYQCEANGLKELAKANCIKIAEVISEGDNFIKTKYIKPYRPHSDFFERFGRSFAQMHRYTNETFGFYEDNFIGVTPQLNIPSEEEKNNWTKFYFNKRLLFQFRLAEKNGYVSSKMAAAFGKLENKIETILKGSEEPPTLLHGDLWSGNFLCDKNNDPVLIDPAVYYGHREADLAMTKLFGGFSPLFYEAYQKELPLPPGWEYRESIYLLYHVLNHLNIFGRSYLFEAERLLQLIVSSNQ